MSLPFFGRSSHGPSWFVLSILLILSNFSTSECLTDRYAPDAGRLNRLLKLFQIFLNLIQQAGI